MKQNYILILILGILLISCDEEKTSFYVTAKVIHDSVPVKNAIISIDQSDQYQTETDDNGTFNIPGVSVGEHLLYAKKDLDDGTFISRSFAIDVKRNIDLKELILPNSIDFVDFELDSVSHILSMSWTKTSANDFVKYNIFAHPDADLNQDTATMIFETTEIIDTVFDYFLPSASVLYFRAYAMNDIGIIGGSKILNLNIPDYNLLRYGNFEDKNAFFTNWITLGNVHIQDSIVKEGSKALLLQSNIDTANIQWTNCTFDSPGFLVEKDQAYELSFWYKASGFAQMDAWPIYFHYVQENLIYDATVIGSSWPGTWVPDTPIKKLDGIDWTHYSTVFYPPDDGNIMFHFSGNVDELYFDELKCVKLLE